MTPGQKVRHERNNLSLSQEELAEKIGCSSQQVKRWESGKSLPQPVNVRKLCGLFHKTPQELGFFSEDTDLAQPSQGAIEETPTPTIEESTSETTFEEDVIAGGELPLSTTVPELQDAPVPPALVKRYSRRKVLIGAGIGIVAVAGGGATLLIASSRSGYGKNHISQSSNTEAPYLTFYVRPDRTSYQVYNVAWSPDGKLIAGAIQDYTVQTWDVSLAKQVATYGPMYNVISGVCWSPDGEFIAGASNDKTVQIWNVADGSKVYTYTGHTKAVASVAWSYDGKYIASSAADRTVQIWEPFTGEHVLTFTGHDELVWTATWSHDNRRIASCGADNLVQIWDAMTGNNVIVCKGHSQPVYDVEWSPDDALLASVSGDKTVRLWNTITGENQYIYYGHSAPVNAVSWSPDGKRIASGGGDPHVPPERNDFTIQTWDAITGNHVEIYRGHTMTVYGVVWSSTGKNIASGSADDTIRIWHAV